VGGVEEGGGPFVCFDVCCGVVSEGRFAFLFSFHFGRALCLNLNLDKNCG
jgi:hypothetical protein